MAATKMELYCRPLEAWPRDPKTVRKVSPFKTPWERTVRKLRAELRHLEARSVVVQVPFPESEISTVTGWPKADRRASQPGVIVAADTRHGALKWLCDDCVKWTDNVHAIALTLERLRLADLYGVTSKGEQYAGWRMLPGPITGAGPTMSIEEAARFVAGLTGANAANLVNDRAAWEAANRAAAKKLHPDVQRDEVAKADWAKLQDAARLLNGLHNRR